MKIYKRMIVYTLAALTALCGAGCNNASSSSSSSGDKPIDYMERDQKYVDKALSDGELSVLTLGNSFSVDAMEYAYEIASDLGLNVRLGNLYEPGCSIFQHHKYASMGAGVFMYYLCENGKWTNVDNYKSLDAVQSYAWDYIVLQHDPDQAGWQNTYTMLPDLINLVKPLCPNATLVWHMTWAYQSDSKQDAFKQYNSNQMEMYKQIIEATEEIILKNEDISMVIPSGTVIQNARTSSLGDTLTRDGYHLSLDNGRYMAGLSYIAKLSGKDVSGLTYKPEGVAEQTRKIAIDSVKKALKTPFAITNVNY